MKLSEIFKQLSLGELSQLAIGNDGIGEIKEEDYEKVIAHINLGLTALYTRFNLKEGEEVIPLVEGTYVYTLTSQDSLKVERVYDAAGKEWALNDEGNSNACRALSPTVLRIPPELLKTSEFVRVGYRANHPLIVTDYGYIDPTTTEVELPFPYLQALLYFVASRCHNPVGMANEFHAGNSYSAKYEAECIRLELENLEIDQGGQYDRLYSNGWV